MYRRYEPKPRAVPDINKSPPSVEQKYAVQKHGDLRQPQNSGHNSGKEKKINKDAGSEVSRSENKRKALHPLMKFIPQSLYNPETGKVFGVLSADDLLIVALILVIIDSSDDCEDNSMLVYALIYILLSEYIELPF